MIDVRPAIPADARRLAELRWEFRSAKATPVESADAFLVRCADFMRDALESRAWHAWVAVDEGTIVGAVWAHLIPKLPNPGRERERHLYVSNMFVTPAARGGIGTRLLEAAIEFAKAQHVDRVILWPTDRSRTMYQRHGFAATGDVFELVLPG